jgi:hypothetical protein
MMRRPLTTLALVATCGLPALGAVIVVTGAGARSISSRARRADAAAMRTWRLSLSPGPGELALAEISFRAGGRQLLSRRSLQAAVSGPFGDDYLATAALRVAGPQGQTALVLLVNRPSPLLDPETVNLRVTARSSLGAPTVRRLADPFTRPAADHAPALCDLRRHGAALTGSQLSAIGARGTPLVGFPSAASAVAQAYDVVCGLPYASSFKQAVEQAAPAPVSPAPSEPVTPTSPAPSPVPPIGKFPGEGCRPTAGRACPEDARSASRASTPDGARPAAAGAH